MFRHLDFWNINLSNIEKTYFPYISLSKPHFWRCFNIFQQLDVSENGVYTCSYGNCNWVNHHFPMGLSLQETPIVTGKDPWVSRRFSPTNQSNEFTQMATWMDVLTLRQCSCQFATLESVCLGRTSHCSWDILRSFRRLVHIFSNVFGSIYLKCWKDFRVRDLPIFFQHPLGSISFRTQKSAWYLKI